MLHALGWMLLGGIIAVVWLYVYLLRNWPRP